MIDNTFSIGIKWRPMVYYDTMINICTLLNSSIRGKPKIPIDTFSDDVMEWHCHLNNSKVEMSPDKQTQSPNSTIDERMLKLAWN